jgi:hypothetical protein
MKQNNGDMPCVFPSFPKVRPPLPAKYRQIYEREYQLNRGGGSFLTRMAAGLEAWMHRRVASISVVGACVLELGAGNLNHLIYEKDCSSYDVVEPFKALYEGSTEVGKIRRFYDSIDDINVGTLYQRVISIAVLEHLENLPAIVAKSARILTNDGVFQAGIPTEGGFLWGMAWRLSTGVGFWLRNKLTYGVLMRHEHVNDAEEIEAVVRYFFSEVRVCRYPLPLRHLSFYSYLEARRPNMIRVNEYLRTSEVPIDK